jgi:hypothetical protein
MTHTLHPASAGGRSPRPVPSGATVRRAGAALASLALAVAVVLVLMVGGGVRHDAPLRPTGPPASVQVLAAMHRTAT